jgi:hypothetical protein
MHNRAGIPLAMVMVVVLLLAAADARAGGGPTVVRKGKISGHLYGGSARAANYFTPSGLQRLFDTAGTSFSAATFGLTLDYGVGSNLELNLDLPIGYYSITSESRFPDRSIFSPAWYGLGATYGIVGAEGEQGLAASVSSMLRIPPGFHSGIYDDPAHPTFLSDGYFQVMTSLNGGYRSETTWINGSLGYNWRDEEPLDEIVYNAEVGFTKVEGTGIFIGLNGVVSTGDVNTPARSFYAGASGSESEQSRIDGGTGRFSTIDRENHISISAGAFVTLTERLVVDGRYVIRLAGNNSLALRGAYLGIGYSIDPAPEVPSGEF